MDRVTCSGQMVFERSALLVRASAAVLGQCGTYTATFTQVLLPSAPNRIILAPSVRMLPALCNRLKRRSVVSMLSGLRISSLPRTFSPPRVIACRKSFSSFPTIGKSDFMVDAPHSAQLVCVFQVISKIAAKVASIIPFYPEISRAIPHESRLESIDVIDTGQHRTLRCFQQSQQSKPSKNIISCWPNTTTLFCISI